MNNQKTFRLPKTKVGYRSFNKIILAAKKLFSKQGYSLTSINHVIDEANVAAGTFYNYFDDKRSVYIYLLDDYSHQIKKSISIAIDAVSKREDKERIGLKTFIKFALNDPLSYRIIWESLFVDQNLFRNYYSSFSASYVKQLTNSVNDGEVSNEIDLEVLSYVLMGVSNFVGLRLLFKDSVTESEIDYTVDQVIKILKDGMFVRR